MADTACMNPAPLTIAVLRDRAANGDRFAAEAVRVYQTDANLQRAMREAREAR